MSGCGLIACVDEDLTRGWEGACNRGGGKDGTGRGRVTAIIWSEETIKGGCNEIDADGCLLDGGNAVESTRLVLAERPALRKH